MATTPTTAASNPLSGQGGQPPPDRVDFALVGLGLQNLLLLLSVLRERPDARIAVLERAKRIGGNHTWSFQESDVPLSQLGVLQPLVLSRWPAYEVAFPGYTRRLESPYATITSDSARAYVEQLAQTHPNLYLGLGTQASEINPDSVALDDGTRIHSDVVADARGPGMCGHDKPCGYQKFLGLELALASASSRSIPLIMDARVPQTDGYRFMYVLPLSPTRVLIEDTYFSDDYALDVQHVREEILQYAESAGYDVGGIVREETGALPLPYGRDTYDRATNQRIGYAGGWFHPATGYSLPVAVRLAHLLATSGRDSEAWHAFSRNHRMQARFCRQLNGLLFRGYEPANRRNVFERFYKLDSGTIRRFYALEMTRADRLRILFGGPPRGFSFRRYVTPTK